MNIALGTAQFGLDYGISNNTGRTEYYEIKKILDYAINVGIDCLDTATEYGECEKIIGETAADRFNIVTKIGKKANIDDFDNSLRMLSSKKIYGVLVHNTAPLFENGGNEIYRKLEEKKYSGLVEKVGVSVYSPREAENILERFNIDIIQVPSSLLDQRFLMSGVLAELKRRNIEVHVRSIFLQGLCFMSENLPSVFDPIKEKILQINRTAAKLSISKIKFMIDYAKSLGVDKIVVGVNSLAQLKEIVGEYNKEIVNIDFSQFSSDSELVDPRSWSV